MERLYKLRHLKNNPELPSRFPLSLRRLGREMTPGSKADWFRPGSVRREDEVEEFHGDFVAKETRLK